MRKIFGRILIWVTVVIIVLAYYYFGAYYGSTVLAFIGISIDDTKTVVEVLRSVIETIALIIAGIWTYERFIKNREDYPYPELYHKIQKYDLGNSFIYMRVFVTVTNKGKIKLKLVKGNILVRQVLPLESESRINKIIKNTGIKDLQAGKNSLLAVDKDEKLFRDQAQRIGWDTLGERSWEKTLRGTMNQLEPGQTREIQFDFLFDSGVEVIEVISYFEFDKSNWELATLHSLAERQKDDAEAPE